MYWANKYCHPIKPEKSDPLSLLHIYSRYQICQRALINFSFAPLSNPPLANNKPQKIVRFLLLPVTPCDIEIDSDFICVCRGFNATLQRLVNALTTQLSTQFHTRPQTRMIRWIYRW